MTKVVCGSILMTSCSGSKTWHGDDDHLTVELFDSNEEYIATKHIDREGREVE